MVLDVIYSVVSDIISFFIGVSSKIGYNYWITKRP